LSALPVIVANMEEAMPGNTLGLFAGTYVMSLTPPRGRRRPGIIRLTRRSDIQMATLL
jgi:hypothetical protein